MRIAAFHNHYIHAGGEDQVHAAEADLLESRGNYVLRFCESNSRIGGMRAGTLFCATIWNHGSYRRARVLLREHRCQVAHFHNTFPLISPAAYYAARREGVAVVQTLHNYRLLCPRADFSRLGSACEDCLGLPVAWPGVMHGCYRRNRAETAVVCAMTALHGLAGTWTNAVDIYIALTEFARAKFIEGGLPEDKVLVKPNFVHPDPGMGQGSGGHALFVGRLTEEKGLNVLLAAWRKLGKVLPLKIVGDGPLAPWLEAELRGREDIEWLRSQPNEKVRALMKDAYVLIFPSIWYEGLPITVLEAYAAGLPVIASRLGSMASLIENGCSGLHFGAGNSEELAACVDWAYSHPAAISRMRREARAIFETRYTAEENYRRLLEIYDTAMGRSSKQNSEPSN